MKKSLVPFRFGNLDDYFKDEENNPNEFLYGTHKLIKSSSIETVFCPRGKRDTILRWISFIFQKPLTMMAYLGMPIEIVFENLSKCREAKNILCINDPISLAFLFAKKIGLINVPLITMFQSITERKLKFFSHNVILIKFFKWLIAGSEKILVLSEAARNELSKGFNVPLDRIEVFRFGADKIFWNYRDYSENREEWILSVGNDMNRDFETLIKALADDIKIVLVTNKKIVNHPNVKVVNGISNIELRDLYHRACAVITPSKKLMTESSGLSTTVQAMACGAPVFLSETPALEEMFKRNEEIFYFSAEDANDLRKVFFENIEDKDNLRRISVNARKAIDERFNSSKMCEAIMRIINF